MPERSQDLDDDQWTFDRWISEVDDLSFVKKTFKNCAALKSKKPREGYYYWTPYRGEPYDEDEFELVPDGWEHVHCTFCWTTIYDGMSCWSNKDEVDTLCEECYARHKDELEARKNR